MKKLYYRIINRVNLLISDMFLILNLLVTTKINKEKKLFLVATPEYHNIGDIAIMEGAKKFLGQHFFQFPCHEITLEVFSRNKFLIKLIITQKDSIFITGGGFLGNMWTESNDLVMHILGNYKKNSVIILSQTMFYTNDNKENDFKKDKIIYEKHNNCLLLVREKKSLKFVAENINFIGNSKCLLAPDMALCLDEEKNIKERDGVLLCLRNDKERKMTPTEYNQILDQIKESGFKKYFNTDTAYPKRVKRKDRIALLENKVSEFLKSELVVTDRLHGMIIAAITKTPCVTIVSASPKILGVYKWIEHLSYIKVITNYNDLKNIIDNIKYHNNNFYSANDLKNEFDNMTIEINKHI